MAEDPKTLLPGMLPQNPSPWEEGGQARKTALQEQVDRVLGVFRQVIPSNYAAQVPGPYYTTQFQSMAEQIASFQITAQEVFGDSFYEYTRPEVLFQILGALVFPDANRYGLPTIEGDITYRTFLRRMVELLLKGATAEVQKLGVELLTDATVEVIERGVEARKLKGGSAWGQADAHTFEVNLIHEVTSGQPYIFTSDPLTLRKNIELVLRALKPAHALYDCRMVFKETFGEIFEETNLNWGLDYDYYHDLRRNWLGASRIAGTSGTTWATDRSLFTDFTRDFASVLVGSDLVITSGPNANPTASATTDQRGGLASYRVIGVLGFLVDDPVARPYTTSGGLSGTGTVVGDDFFDSAQTLWHTVGSGESLTISQGPNAGTYRMKLTLGAGGGPAGHPLQASPCSGIRVAQSTLQLRERLSTPATLQSYTVVVDRLGVQIPRHVVDEDVTNQFYGSTGSSDTVRTARGPLVKSWGDGTPAEIFDVEVAVNGTPATLSTVNPYTGEITLVAPLTFPQTDVKVSYYWLPSPVMSMAGLNTEGLVLSQWDIPLGHNAPPAHGAQVQDATHPKGAMSLSRFPMSVVLGPPDRPQPQRVGHRYIGFEKSASALLNSPTTFILNQNPNKTQVPGFENYTEGVTASYEGTEAPASSTPAWFLTGVDTGVVNSDGTYTLIDAAAGDPTLAVPKVASYSQEVNLTFPSTTYLVGRFKVTETVPDGIFTGVGFGAHDDQHFYFAGAILLPGKAGVITLDGGLGPLSVTLDGTALPNLLWIGSDTDTASSLADLINTSGIAGVSAVASSSTVSVTFASFGEHTLAAVGTGISVTTDPGSTTQHIGLLKDAQKARLLEGWTLGPYASGTVSAARDSVTFLTADLPQGIVSGSRFQVLSGTQAGTYTVDTVTRNRVTRKTTLTVTAKFPAAANLWGNNPISALFETRWDEAATYRLVFNPDAETATLSVSGRVTGTLVTVDGDTLLASTPAANSPLVVDTSKRGEVIWGSIYSQSTSTSVWSFMRYGLVPDQTALRGFISTVTNDFATTDTLPEDDTSNEWFPPEPLGWSKTLPTVGMILNAGSSGLFDNQYGYDRVEGFLSGGSILNLYATYKADYGTRGAGDAEIVIRDGKREICLATLTYTEGLTSPYRQLVDHPFIAFNGFTTADQQLRPATQATSATGEVTFAGLESTASLVILDNALITVGDTIVLNGVVMTAVAGVPVGAQFQIGANAAATAASIANTFNTWIAFSVYVTATAASPFINLVGVIGSLSTTSLGAGSGLGRSNITNDTITIGGVTFTGTNTATVEAREFDISGTDTNTANSFLNVLNDPVNQTLIASLNSGAAVTATQVGSVVTLLADTAGDLGRLAVTSSNGTRIALAGLTSGRLSLTESWVLDTGNTTTGMNRDLDYQMLAVEDAYIVVTGDLDFTTISNLNVNDERRAEFRFAVPDYSAVPRIEASVWAPDVTVDMDLKLGPPGVLLKDQFGVTQGTYAFDWTDGEQHSYVITISGGVVSLIVDGTLIAPALNTALFPGDAGADSIHFGIDYTGYAQTATVLWRAVNYAMIPGVSAIRTLGVWLGGDKSDINNWEIPRSDSSSARNSDQTGPAIQQMNWTSLMDVQIYLNDQWGVTVIRPDLAAPPYYVAGEYPTQIVNSTSGWINVEYPKLPRVSGVFGSVAFGSLESYGVTQQVWESVSYTLAKTPTDDHQSAPRMVLNQFNVITSGERKQDYTLETVTATPEGTRRVSLVPSHQYAQEVYKILDGSTIYTRNQWVFDTDAQTVTLNSGYSFSGAAVTVMFIPGVPVTTTYLINQPLFDSAVLLNDTTPPFPKSRMAEAHQVTVSGTTGNVLTFEDDAETLYEGMEFMEVTDGGWERLIAVIGEGWLSDNSDEQADEGDKIYSLTGLGPSLGGVGNSAGLKETGDYIGGPQSNYVIGFSGPMFNETRTFPQEEGVEIVLDGVFVLATGNFYRGPVTGRYNRALILNSPSSGVLGV